MDMSSLLFSTATRRRASLDQMTPDDTRLIPPPLRSILVLVILHDSSKLWEQLVRYRHAWLLDGGGLFGFVYSEPRIAPLDVQVAGNHQIDSNSVAHNHHGQHLPRGQRCLEWASK